MANKKYNDNSIDTSDGIFVHVSFLHRLYLGTTLPRVFDISYHQNVYCYEHGAWKNVCEYCVNNNICLLKVTLYPDSAYFDRCTVNKATVFKLCKSNYRRINNKRCKPSD